MGAKAKWVLIFSDGTGQCGVPDLSAPIGGLRNTSIFRMFEAVQGQDDIRAFYDPGLGAPDRSNWGWFRWGANLWSKATGYGITTNIVDCYEAVLGLWEPGMKIGLFGFSRGAYTVRSLGGVLKACGIATQAGGRSIARLNAVDPEGAKLRRRIAQRAVDIYKLSPKTREVERKQRIASFRRKHLADATEPAVIGVFDTVKALQLPGTWSLTDPFRHQFHDNMLSENVPVGLHALAIDEDRRAFQCEAWKEPKAASQYIEQRWFPGVHSDIGGAYAGDTGLGDQVLEWMLQRLQQKVGLAIDIPMPDSDKMLGRVNSNRDGWGRLWRRRPRDIPNDRHDFGELCENIEDRFRHEDLQYRPRALFRHPRVSDFYASISQPATNDTFWRAPERAKLLRAPVASKRPASS